MSPAQLNINNIRPHGIDLTLYRKEQTELNFLLNVMGEIRGHVRRIGPLRSTKRREKSLVKLVNSISTFNALSLPNFWVTVDDERNIHLCYLSGFKGAQYFVSHVDICWIVSQSDEPFLSKSKRDTPVLEIEEKRQNRFDKYFQ